LANHSREHNAILIIKLHLCDIYLTSREDLTILQNQIIKLYLY